VIGNDAILRTNLTTPTTSGLRLATSFSVTGVFDLVISDSPREEYGIRLTDRLVGGSGTPPNQAGDDTVALTNRKQGRRCRCPAQERQLRGRHHHAFPTDRVGAAERSGPDQSAPQPRGKRFRVTASFDYMHLGSVIDTQSFTTTAPIFNNEDWTRAEIVADAPAINDSALSGTHGTLDISQSGAWIYTLDNSRATTQSLAQGQTATDTFTVKVADQFGGNSTTPVTITVTGTNDAPLMQTGPATRALTEDSGLDGAGNLVATGLADFSDVDLTDTHTTSAVLQSATLSGGGSLPAGLATLLANAIATPTFTDVSTGDGHGEAQWNFALANSAALFLAAGQTLTAVYNVTVTDPFGATATQAVTVTIAGANDAPVAVNDSASGDEDTAITTGNVLANDSDVDNTLTAASINAFTQGAHGAVVNNGDGTFTYTPTLNFNGADSFTYTVTDGSLNSTATVNVTVNPVNDAPVAMADIEATAATFVRSTANYAVKSGFSMFPSDNLTIEFMTQVDADNTALDTFMGYATTTGNDNTFVVFRQGDSIATNIRGVERDYSAPALFDQQWHHVALTYNAASGVAKAFLDGVAIGSSTYSPGALPTGGTFILGQEQDTLGGTFDVTQSLIGAMSDVNIWSRVLSASEIADASNGIVALNDANLVAAYRYNPATQAFDDASGHGNGMTTVGSLPGRMVTEQTSLDLKGTALSVSDVDAGSGVVTVTLSVGEGALTATAGSSGATVSGSGGSSVTINGTVAQINALLSTDAASTVSYIDNTDTPSASTVLTLSVNDNGNTGAGGPLSATTTATINITAVNDAPVATITPTSYSATEQTSLNLKATGLSVSDVDAGNGSVTATLSVGQGTLTVTAGASGATVSGSNSSTVTINGTLVQINALLSTDGTSTVSYSDNTNTPSASTVLTLTVNDNGNTGVGLPLSSSDTATINITAVNDAPVNGKPGAQTTAEDTAKVFSTANGNAISISDVDVGAGNETVTLAVTNGALTLSGIAGLSFSAGDGTADATMTFSGTVAAINTALNGLSYAPTADFNGSSTLTITTNDNGNTGIDPGLTDGSGAEQAATRWRSP
jgi:VCBS repeat-containing protein